MALKWVVRTWVRKSHITSHIQTPERHHAQLFLAIADMILPVLDPSETYPYPAGDDSTR